MQDCIQQLSVESLTSVELSPSGHNTRINQPQHAIAAHTYYGSGSPRARNGSMGAGVHQRLSEALAELRVPQRLAALGVPQQLLDLLNGAADQIKPLLATGWDAAASAAAPLVEPTAPLLSRGAEQVISMPLALHAWYNMHAFGPGCSFNQHRTCDTWHVCFASASTHQHLKLAITHGMHCSMPTCSHPLHIPCNHRRMPS